MEELGWSGVVTGWEWVSRLLFWSDIMACSCHGGENDSDGRRGLSPYIDAHNDSKCPSGLQTSWLNYSSV